MLLVNGARSSSGLIGHWRCNQGAGVIAPDYVRANNVTLTNGPTWGTGSIVFDGSNDFCLRASTDFGLNNAVECSLSFYLKTSATSGRIFQKELPSFNSTIDARIGASNAVVFFLHNATMEPSWQYTAPLDGTFHLYTFTFKVNAGNIFDGVLYIDKSSVAASAFFANGYTTGFLMQESSNNLYFAVKSGVVEFLNGELKDIRLYNKQLSSGEVSNLP